MIELVLKGVNLLVDFISGTWIVVFVDVLSNLLALLLERLDSLTEGILDVVRILVVDELEILSLDLARVKIVDSISNTSPVAFR